MGDPLAKSLPSLGFLAVLAHDELGLFGGYLATTSTGRPLEFHCTTPVKPNRAQEILYGPTLGQYVYGELIGAALLGRGAQSPALIFTDAAPALAVRDHVDAPVALVEPWAAGCCDAPGAPSKGASSPGQFAAGGVRLYQNGPSDAGQPTDRVGSPRLTSIELSPWRISVHADRAADIAAIRRLAESQLRLDLLEPFQRIRQAICEAQRIRLSCDPPLAQAG
jgi:hypothetical protein